MAKQVSLFMANSVLYGVIGLIWVWLLQLIDQFNLPNLLHITLVLLAIFTLLAVANRIDPFKDVKLLHPLHLSRLSFLLVVLIVI